VLAQKMSSHDHLKNLIQRIELSLTNHYTISIATAAKEESWSASVFYVSDQKLNIYFISFDESKHIQGILKNKRVSATINQDVSDWMQIKGLQLQGVAYKVPEQHRKNILNTYRQKFDSIHELLDLPKTDDEKKIAKQFNSISLFCFEPHWIRLLDNSLGFGSKEEIEIKNQTWLIKE
jgi:hypothetical protein